MVFPKPEFIIERLTKAHDLSSFDCGTASLNEWLQRFALQNQQADAAKVYVTHRRDDIVVGYHSVTASSVGRDDAPARVAKGLANHPIGVALLGRLAVDRRQHGKGLGRALLLDALMRTAQAADTIGIRAILVHAIDEDAKRFYLHFNFEVAPVDPMHLMLLMKDLRALLRKLGLSTFFSRRRDASIA
jgi:GNAT superfamily N-acetyltransferase